MGEAVFIPDVTGFVGREMELGELGEKVAATRTTFIVGYCGGVGKTALGARFAREKLSALDLSPLWVTLTDNATQDTLYRQIGRLEIGHFDPQLPDRGRGMAIGRALNEKGVCLFLDDFQKSVGADGESRLAETLLGIDEVCRRGRMIVLSRELPDLSYEVEGGGACVDTGGLGVEEIRRLMAALERPCGEGPAALMSERVGGHPLALRLIRALADYGSYEEILESWENLAPEKAVRFLVEKNLERLEREELRLLRAASVFLLPFDMAAFGYVLGRKARVSETGRLVDSCLMEMNRSNKTLALHPLIREIVFEAWDGEERTEACLAAASHYLGRLQGSEGDLPALEQYTEMLWRSGDEERFVKGCWTIRDRKMRHFFLDSHELDMRRVLALAREKGDEEAEAAALSNIGSVHHDRGNLDRALEHHKSALALGKKVLGPRHPNVSAGLNNLGDLYRRKGKYQQALDYLERTLAIDEKVLGPEHPNVAVRLNNIGLVHLQKGDPSRALEYFERALAIDEKALGAEHRNIAVRLYNIGMARVSLGEEARALECLERARAIFAGHFGPNHFRTRNIGNRIESVKGRIGSA